MELLERTTCLQMVENGNIILDRSTKVSEKEIKLTDDLTKSITHERPRPQGNPPVSQGTVKPASGVSGSSFKKRK
jgi:hypothetical protein